MKYRKGEAVSKLFWQSDFLPKFKLGTMGLATLNLLKTPDKKNIELLFFNLTSGRE
jgi:hypothetical protein